MEALSRKAWGTTARQRHSKIIMCQTGQMVPLSEEWSLRRMDLWGLLLAQQQLLILHSIKPKYCSILHRRWVKEQRMKELYILIRNNINSSSNSYRTRQDYSQEFPTLEMKSQCSSKILTVVCLSKVKPMALLNLLTHRIRQCLKQTSLLSQTISKQ